MSILKYKFSLFFLMLIMVVGCKREEDFLMKGHVVIRAEERYPIGLIRVHLFENKDPFYEEPIRAIVYHFDSLNILDLGDTVVFRVKENKKWQWAEKVEKYKNQKLGTTKQRYSAVHKMWVNLHLADSNHREGPFHKFGHIRGDPTEYSSEYSQITVRFNTTDPNMTVFEDYLINTLSIPQDTSIGYFFGVIDSIQESTGKYLKIVEVTAEHTHTYGPH